MPIDYKPRITVLHVEDENDIIYNLRTELINRNIYVHSVLTLKEAIDVLRKCDVDFVISNGMFTKKEGLKESKSFMPLVQKISKLRKDIEIIAWSDSTHFHEYCKEHGLLLYSKTEITKERFVLKKRKYIPVRRIEAKELADIIEKRIAERSGFLKVIKETKFDSYYKEPATILGIFMAMDMRTGMFGKTAGIPYKPCISEIKNGVFDVFVDNSNDAEVSRFIYKKITEQNYFPTINKNVISKSRKLLSFSKSLKSKDYKKLSNKKLASLYLKFCELFMEMRTYSSLPTALEHVTSAWTNNLKNILKQKITNEEEYNKTFSILTSPDKDSYLKQFEAELAKIGLKKVQKQEIKKDIEILIDNYAWINYGFEGIPITQDDVLKRVDELGKTKEDFEKILTDGSARLGKLKREKRELIRKYNLTDKDIEMFEIGAEIVYIKYFRKGTFAESYYNMEFLLKEIAKRIGCERKHAINMFPDEILAALELNSFPKELIESRLKESVIFHKDGKSYGLSKERKISREEKIMAANLEIKGQVAYTGRVRGYVKIVNVPEDMSVFKEGDVLVSRSTHPALVPVMRKAVAFVTDLGGLTCHAAIVAREMKKPCIIGTGISTKVLKDGDYIEVDANNGLVRIIK